MTLVGSRIGKYDIISEIGTGGMAAVYLARSAGRAGVRRLVAIKVMHPHLSQDEQFVDMFLDEARVASAIHHPNVVPIIDVGQEDNLIFLVMDYIEGDSFSNVEKVAVNLRRRIPVGITLRVCLDALSGLHSAHEMCNAEGQHLKIIHRDVSPQNIVIGVDGSSRIVDFGIAKAESRNTHTQVGMIKGKLNFMAPEQLRSQPLDRRVDIFGMGVTIWEAITLRRLFAGDNDFETATRILKGEYPSLLDFDPKLPPALDQIVRQSLRPNPDERFSSAEDFAEAIEQHLKPQVASHRDVAAFISGVASQKLERERKAVREWASGGDDDPMAATMVEGGRRGRVEAPVDVGRGHLPNTAAPRPKGDSSGPRSKVRAPTLAMPVGKANAPAQTPRLSSPNVATPADTAPSTPMARIHNPPAKAQAPTGRSGVRAPTRPGAALPSDPPGDPTVAMDIPVGGHLPYDDEGDTEMFANRGAAPSAFQPRGASGVVLPPPEDEPEFEGARTVFEPMYSPPSAAARSPEPSNEFLPPSAIERTQAIDLVQRRPSEDPYSLGGYAQPPAQEPQGGPAQPAGQPVVMYGMPNTRVTGGQATGPVAAAQEPRGLSPWVYVFVSVALLSVASALLWFVTHRRA
ncbi:MAG: protein kinase [Myxococcales bacterium]|nr:protein kinase [Myxococcales bacterium]